MSTELPPPTTPVVEDRTVAILSYITIIGFIVAIVIHSSKKTQLGAFHLRQVLGLFVTGVVCAFFMIIPLLNLILIPVLGIIFFVLWLLGIIAAASGQQKPVPVIGEKYQQWFANAFT